MRGERERELRVHRCGATGSRGTLVRDVRLPLQEEIHDDRASRREARGDDGQRQVRQQQARVHLHHLRPGLRPQGDPEVALRPQAHPALRLLVRALRQGVQDQG